MAENSQPLTESTAIAQFRYALIAPVVQDLYPDKSKTAYYKRVTENELTLPNGSKVRLKHKTLEKWYSMYQKGGFEALLPKERADKGSTRVISDEAMEEIFRLKKDYPRLNATQIHNHLVTGSFIPATVSVSATQRFIKSHDLKYASNLEIRDRKAFEEDAFGRMWQADYPDVLFILIFLKNAV